VFFSCSIVAKKSNEQYFQQGLLEFFCEFPSWLVFVDMQMDFFCNFLGFLMIDGKIVFVHPILKASFFVFITKQVHSFSIQFSFESGDFEGWAALVF